MSRVGGGGVRPDEGELNDGAGGNFGGLTLFNTATPQQLLGGTHSKAHKFKKEQE